jgi:hypothetical protein
LMGIGAVIAWALVYGGAPVLGVAFMLLTGLALLFLVTRR